MIYDKSDSITRIYAAATLLEEWSGFTDDLEQVVANDDLAEALRYYAKFKRAYEALDVARKKAFKHLDYLNKSIIPKKLEDADLADGVRVQIDDQTGYNFRVQTQYSAKQNDREALYAWLRERGDGELITETVNASTLASYLKGLMLDEGIEVPQEMAELTTYEITGMTKYTPKG